VDLIDARNITKVFRRRRGPELAAVADITLSVARGSFLAIAGPSGSGKSTLLSLLAALDQPSSGELYFDGTPLHAAPQAVLTGVRRRTGIVFQDYSLLPNLSVIDNIDYALIPRRIPRHQRRARALDWLARLALADAAHERAGELSGGECQRVALARALAGDPEVLLADEPTSNLDEPTARRVIDLLQAFHSSGKTVIAVSHDPALLAQATQVATLAGGRLESFRSSTGSGTRQSSDNHYP
jgi:putative ABC transport system ATP-binding protein